MTFQAQLDIDFQWMLRGSETLAWLRSFLGFTAKWEPQDVAIESAIEMNITRSSDCGENGNNADGETNAAGDGNVLGGQGVA